MNWLERNTPSRLRLVSECRGFVIAADNPSDGHMPWWQAKNAELKDVASGYGDKGLAHCKLHCELAAARPVEQPIERVNTECQRVVIGAPGSPPAAPAEAVPQQTLF